MYLRVCICDFRIVSCLRAQAGAETPPFPRELLLECRMEKTGTSKIIHLKKGKEQKNLSFEKKGFFCTFQSTLPQAHTDAKWSLTKSVRKFTPLCNPDTHSQSASISVSVLLAVTCMTRLAWFRSTERQNRAWITYVTLDFSRISDAFLIWIIEYSFIQIHTQIHKSNSFRYVHLVAHRHIP